MNDDVSSAISQPTKSAESTAGDACLAGRQSHSWLETEFGHDICIECKLTRPNDVSSAHGIGFAAGQKTAAHVTYGLIDSTLEKLALDTPPDHDDSQTGIYAAWDAIRALKAKETGQT